MNPMQKMARYNLIVVMLALAVFLVLIPLIGLSRAQAAFALLALTAKSGFDEMRWRKKLAKKEIVVDERDRIIGSRALIAVWVATHLYVVAVCMITWSIYFSRGEEVISISFLPMIVVGAWVIFLLVNSIAVLVQYGDIADKLSDMTALQTGAWGSLIIFPVVLTPFLLGFPIGDDKAPLIFGPLVFLSFCVVFFLQRRSWRSIEIGEKEQAVLRRAEKTELWGLVISLVLGIAGLSLLYENDYMALVSLNNISYTGFCAVAVSLLVKPVSILVLYSREPKEIADAEK